jgi:hypothetical protein
MQACRIINERCLLLRDLFFDVGIGVFLLLDGTPRNFLDTLKETYLASCVVIIYPLFYKMTWTRECR